MAVEKLSVSMETALAKLVRSAASEDRVSVSTWLSEAATAKTRHRALRVALTAYAAEHGALDPADATALVAAARARSVVSRPRKRP